MPLLNQTMPNMKILSKECSDIRVTTSNEITIKNSQINIIPPVDDIIESSVSSRNNMKMILAYLNNLIFHQKILYKLLDIFILLINIL